MKSEFDGHCQLCGRLQRLPGGLLAKHGYNVHWGFFSGTCPGSDATPFEVSKHLIDGQIAHTKASIAALELGIAAVLASEDTTKVWVHEYLGSNKLGGIYRDRLADIVRWERSNYGGTAQEDQSWSFVFVGRNWQSIKDCEQSSTKQCRYPSFEQNKSQVALVKFFNKWYADTVLAKQLGQLKSYVAWLEVRARDWAPAPLIPRKGGR